MAIFGQWIPTTQLRSKTRFRTLSLGPCIARGSDWLARRAGRASAAEDAGLLMTKLRDGQER